MFLQKYENSTIEYKSLKKAIGVKADLKELAKTCVCLANTQGGYLFIGIEDKDKLPVGTQRIWPARAFTLGHLTHNDLASVRI